MRQEKLIEKVYNFQIEQYTAYIEVIFTNNLIESSRKRIEKYCLPEEVVDAEIEVGARCATAYPNFALFYDFDKLRIDYITHETFHLTHAVLASINSYYDYDNHEHFAYLNGYLNRKVFNLIDKNKFKVLI